MNIIPLPTNYQFVNLTGKKFAMLTVICYAGKNKKIRSGKLYNGKTRWLCQCECKNLTIVNNSDLKSGKHISCGCLKDVKTSARSLKHGMTYTPTYASWSTMIQRCTNHKNPRFKDYGGRGITVCDRWLNSFDDFYADMGERPEKMTLDRIDVNQNYELINCRWATKKQQSRNLRNNRIAIINGQRKTAVDIAEEYGVKYATIISRMNRGMNIPLFDHDYKQLEKHIIKGK